MREKLKDSSITIVSGLDMTLSVEDEDGTVLSRQIVKTSGIRHRRNRLANPAERQTRNLFGRGGLGRGRIPVGQPIIQGFTLRTAELRRARHRLTKISIFPIERVAEVRVDAMYLFGKPVASGTVKVVREGSRNWNYREQKWDIEEEAVYAGATDADGKYKAKIDLGPAQDKFKDDEDSKFEDLNFTAYFTDSSTNRTEQKRFDLRISKEPIHVYVNKARRYSDHSPKIPYRLYVSTFTADGKPIACDVEVTGKYEDESATRPIATFRTSADGAGKTEFLVPKRADDNYL
ncbi:MAG: hypothetical protein IPN69_24085 [Acidobacteria bacterium]|nr:hypothetical protein [Acidobacteriota bacterium]